ncbi:MAG TPA: lysophospholipid acyltransferase family protein [Roseiarcus sp.]|nr:lysophospholipid acyltransferase family protein [Roseiarcus sp.]
MLGLRSLVFNVLFYATLVVLMIIGLPSVLMGRHAVFFMGRLWGACSLWLLKHICGLTIEFRGVENIPQGGYIIASKHQSFLETFSLLKRAPDFAYVLKRELTYIPFFGWYLWGAEQISIDRARGRSALAVLGERATKVLRSGRQIFIFPEGTRRAPGAPPQYKQGVFHLYADSGAPCLPVALNTGLYWGRRGFTRRPGVAIIEYLPVIPPGLERDAFLAKLQDSIETACARLNAEALAKDASLALKLASAQI